MTKEAALYAWFNAAIPDVPAYVETAVPSKANGDPTDATEPYLTYSVPDAGFGEETSMVVNLWFRTQSEAAPNAAARTLYEMIGNGGVIIRYDDGAVWLKRGTPFSQPVRDDDPHIKRRYINITEEKISA